MKPHKHAELIKAWADGQAEVEYRYPKDDGSLSLWKDLTQCVFHDWYEYRIKPAITKNNTQLHPVKELTDDGDAFRLAVKLKIEVYHGNDEGDAVYAGYYTPENTVMKYCIEYYDDITHMGDACSATRRAIVRAATEIGKTNPLRKASEK